MSASEALDAIGLLPDTEIDIAGAALQLGRQLTPEADWRAAELHLSSLARETVERAQAIAPEALGATLGARAAVLAGVIGEHHHYIGDAETYDAEDNANLIAVTNRRKGLPVALGVVWLHAARAAGWAAYGVDFPGHFLVALDGRGTKQPSARLVLDVFAGGTPLGASELRTLLRRIDGEAAELRPGLLAPMSTRAVLLRLQNNLKLRRLQAGAIAPALAVVEDMLRIAPDEAPLWREAAALNQRLDRVTAALACLDRFLAIVPSGEAAARARAAAGELRARLN